MSPQTKQVIIDSLKYAQENGLITFDEWQKAFDEIFRVE